MSKNKQILIWSLVGVAVLGIVTAILLLTAPDKQSQDAGSTGQDSTLTEEADDLTLFNRSENEIASVNVTNSSGSYTILPTGGTDSDGKPVWTVEGIGTAPLNETDLAAAAGYGVSLEAREFVEEITDSSQLAKYGLAEPRASVVTKLNDGTELTLSVGDEVPTSSTSVYITADGKNVYTYYKSRCEYFLRNRLGFVDLTAVPAYDQSSGEEVRRMTIERIDLEEPIVLEAILPDDENAIQVYTYRMLSPYTAYADLTDVPTFVYSLFGLTASECEWVGMEEQDYEIAGLNEPNCVVTVETNQRTYKLTLGKALVETKEDDSGSTTQTVRAFYGVSDDRPDILYRFEASDLPMMSIQPEKLLSKLFLMPYIYSLNSLRYSDPEGRDVTIGIETIPAKDEDSEDQHSFTLNGEPTKDQPVKDLYQYLISAAGEELYFDSDKGELLAEIVYSYNDRNEGMNGSDTVRFYSSNTDRKVIIELNGENLFKTRQGYVTQLYSNIDNYLSGGEIVYTY